VRAHVLQFYHPLDFWPLSPYPQCFPTPLHSSHAAHSRSLCPRVIAVHLPSCPKASWLETKYERGYVANKGTQQLPIEFINEHWYILYETKKGFVTRADDKQGRINELGLGSLPKEKKPQISILTEEAPTPSGFKEKDVKVTTGGLHHILTTQGINPLIEEKLPTFMQGIKKHICQGGEVTVDIPPAGAIHATTTMNLPQVNIINDGSRGSLKGDPLNIFDGTRSKAETFKDEFSIYWKINRNNASMKESLTRILMALSFIKGEKVKNWVRGQMVLSTGKQWHQEGD
jgi:hypothetical protein